jgi:chromosomal replication initiation ATPase DnaA
MEMKLSIETQEQHEELLALRNRVCERWEADRFERDINNLEKVCKRIENNQDVFEQRVTQQLLELHQEQ